MDTDQGAYSGYQHLGIAMDGELSEKFKRLVSMEDSTFNKTMGHLMANYANYLDRSFLENSAANRKKKGKVHLLFDVPSHVFSAFDAKIEREGLKLSSVVVPMIENYVRFASKVYENDES